MEYVPLVVVMVVALLASCGLLVNMLGRSLLRPPRMTDGKAAYVLKRVLPSDVGLVWEAMDFLVEDASKPGEKIKIAGWWMPREGAKWTAVVIHGYADAKVGALAWAPMWHGLGFNVLAIDLRGHGESGGVNVTGGFFERDDVERVIRELRARREGTCEKIVLFGVSLGGAVACATAVRESAADLGISAVVCDGLFRDYRRAARHHAKLVAAPGRFLHGLAIRWAEWRSGARFDDVKPEEALERIRVPVMLIHGDQDAFVPPEDWSRLAGVVTRHGHHASWVCDRAGHINALNVDPTGYEDRVRAFVERVL
jgi:pimeloyl-ACP methyl ester carboxylesterase